MQKLRVISFAVVAVMSTGASLAAADVIIRGVVSDSNGNPVRAALVKVQSGYKIVTRYSQNDGRYEIAVQPGDYSVTADAFGYGSKSEEKVTASSGETNFKLSPRIDVTHLTGAEVMGLLP